VIAQRKIDLAAFTVTRQRANHPARKTGAPAV